MKKVTFLSEIPVAPADPVLGITEHFVKDARPEKVNLGVGVYQNADGKAVKLSVVRKAEAILMETDLSATYGPIDGVKEFNRHSAELVFGADSKLLANGQVTTVQSPGGTGAVRLGAELIRLFSPVKKLLFQIQPGTIIIRSFKSLVSKLHSILTTMQPFADFISIKLHRQFEQRSQAQ